MMGVISQICAYFQSCPASSLEQANKSTLSIVPMTRSKWREDDKYDLVRSLNSGGQADTTLLRSKRTGKVLVVKHTFKFEHGPTWRLPEEYRILLTPHGLNKLSHPNILSAFGVLRSPEEGRWCIFTEYCSGGDLNDQHLHMMALPASAYGRTGHDSGMASPDIEPPARLVPDMWLFHTFLGLTSALHFLHGGSGRTPIIHRDLKPENILIRFPPRECGMPEVVLADFGLAEFAAECDSVAGSTLWTSPEALELFELEEMDNEAYNEQMLERRNVMTTKSDIYGLGLVMYSLATSYLWVPGADPNKLCLPEAYTTEACCGLTSAIAWCLAVKQGERPEASELMPIMDMFRESRDRLFKTKGPLPTGVWKALSSDQTLD
jgi:serine/threonine protein kinase